MTGTDKSEFAQCKSGESEPDRPGHDRHGPERPELPLTSTQIAAAAAALALPMPSECGEGVAANLRLLARHLDTLRHSAGKAGG